MAKRQSRRPTTTTPRAPRSTSQAPDFSADVSAVNVIHQLADQARRFVERLEAAAREADEARGGVAPWQEIATQLWPGWSPIKPSASRMYRIDAPLLAAARAFGAADDAAGEGARGRLAFALARTAWRAVDGSITPADAVEVSRALRGDSIAHAEASEVAVARQQRRRDTARLTRAQRVYNVLAREADVSARPDTHEPCRGPLRAMLLTADNAAIDPPARTKATRAQVREAARRRLSEEKKADRDLH